MKAVAVIPGKRGVALIDPPEPRLAAPTDVKIRMLEVGICGTDREICAFQYGEAPPSCDHLVLGHEGLGQVVDAGSDVDGLAPGDLVVPTVRRPCPDADCAPCRSGRQDFCRTGRFTERGIKQAHGFLAEFAVDTSSNLTRIPGHLADVAVLVEPLTIVQKAMIQLRSIGTRIPCRRTAQRGNAVVLGAGPVGILGAMTLTAAGYRTHVYSRAKPPHPKVSLVESFGATYLSSSEILPSSLADRIGNIDLVYEAAGVSSVSFELLKALGINGVYIFTGIPASGPSVPHDLDGLMRNLVLKNQLILGTVNAGPDAFSAAALDLERFHQRWPAALRSLITGRFPIEAYDRLLLGAGAGIKSVIRLS